MALALRVFVRNISRTPTITIANPPKLRRIPLPTLEETCYKYIPSVAPLLTETELQQTQASVQDLLRNSGPRLQAELQKLADGSGYPESWIEGFWDDMYLNGRWALPINSNPFLMWNSDPLRTTQASRAASVTVSTVKFAYKIFSEELEVAFVGKNPLDSFQYSRMFHIKRLPALHRDLLVPKKATNIHHIIVFHGGRQFKINVLHQQSGQMIDERTLEGIFKQILEGTHHQQLGLGLLTTTERDQWASTRSEIIRDATTARTIQEIDDALFVVGLDANSNTNQPLLQTCHSFLHGSPQIQPIDRWFDKPISLLFSRDGHACLNFEHSWGDGVPCGRLLHEVWYDTQHTPSGFSPLKGSDTLGLLKVDGAEELKVNETLLEPILSKASNEYAQFTSSVDGQVLIFDGFGKDEIKLSKISPNSFVQMAYQLAYYRVYGNVVSTYESCNVQTFHHGRTETIRPVTAESKRFVEAYDLNEEFERFRLLTQATSAHSHLADLAKEARGVDRHLLGLYSIAKRDNLPIPSLFSEPAYQKYTANLISTSTVALPFCFIAGFGAVHTDGYGIAFMVYDDQIHLFVTSFKTSTVNKGSDVFVQAIKTALQDMHQTLKFHQANSNNLNNINDH